MQGVLPIFNLPTDGDDYAVSSVYQPLKATADYLAWLMKSRVHPIFGNAVNGDGAHDVDYTMSTTISTPLELNNMTVEEGVVLQMGAPIQVRGTLTLNDGAALICDGPLSGYYDTGTASPLWLRTGTKGGMYAGATPVAFGYAPTDIDVVAPGGNGGNGGTGTGGAGQAGATWATVAGWTPTASGILMAPPGFWAGPVDCPASSPTARVCRLHALAGGMGGGAGGAGTGSDGGDGGHGAGVVWIAARNVVVNGTPIVTAMGSDGYDASNIQEGGGSGGGGGGVIVLIYESITGAGDLTTFTSVAGGAVGAGTGTPTAGSAGKVIEIPLKSYL
jgi:hypothetical protein